MSLDQQIYGSTDWHFPSPSSTPKSTSFPETSFQTPKAEVYQSHFLDAWSTPQINGNQTPAQTPSLACSTPLERPSSSYSYQPKTPQDPDFHVNHFTPQHLPLPPVDPSRRLSSSPDPLAVKRDPVISRRTLASPQTELIEMDSSQMQTPPPTRDATSRRSFQQGMGQDFATPATVISRTPVPLSANQGFPNQTPFGFPSLQFSPDMFQFPNSGPMSAPAMPQSRLFWDQPSDGNSMDVDMPIASDPFGPTPHKIEGPVGWSSFNTPSTHMNPQAFEALHGLSSANQDPTFVTSSIDGGNASSKSRPNSFIATSGGVDPSMLFSFSSPGPTTSFNQSSPQKGTHPQSRQPYETQMQDSLRERELAKKAKSQHSRTDTSSSSGSLPDVTRPGLQRSNTDSGFRKNKASIDSRLSGSVPSHHIPRRSSPLKRQSGGSLTSIPEIRRPRTRLVIDESGRARTETGPVDEDKEPRPDPRRQYPELWNDDDSDSESDLTTKSRNTSFNMPLPQRRSSKHARTESGVERSDSFKMARPSSGIFDKASFDTSRPIRQKPSDLASRRFSMMEFPTSFGSQQNDNDKVSESPGDALGALKKVVEGRQSRIDRSVQNTLKAHNQRWAQASADLANPGVSPLIQYDPFTSNFNASPSTNTDTTGLTTPSTDRSSLSSEGTRCVCNSNDHDGQLMIQCESCTKWLHVRCVGLNTQTLPPVYVCIFCTGQTPVARGGRIRGPMPAAFDSPLGHKSAYRR